MIEFKIANRKIGENHPPFIIAEMSGNHNGDINKALDIIKAASESGVDAIKLQTYTPDTLTINHQGGLFDITDKTSLWHGKNLYELYREAHTPWDWHKEIFEYANSLGLIAFSSPFDESAVDFLEELDVPAYKIASFESNHFPLLKKVAKTGKPILISSGTSKLNELYESVDYLKKEGAKDIVLFKCTSTYPASAENTNLNTIPVLKNIFADCIVGLSDHTMGIGASVGAVALGARVIEKHFTLDRAEGGVDSAFSLEPSELKDLVVETNRVFLALGHVQLDTQKSELKSRQFKRSIYCIRDIEKGEIFTKDNLKIIRPGDGLEPKYYERVLGIIAKSNIKRGTPLSFDMI